MQKIAKFKLVMAVVAAGLGSASVAAATTRQVSGRDTCPASASFVFSDTGRPRLCGALEGVLPTMPVGRSLSVGSDAAADRRIIEATYCYYSGQRYYCRY